MICVYVCVAIRICVCVAKNRRLRISKFSNNRTKYEVNFFFYTSCALFRFALEFSLINSAPSYRNAQNCALVDLLVSILTAQARARQTSCSSIRVFFGSTQGHTHKYSHKNSSLASVVYVSMCVLYESLLIFFFILTFHSEDSHFFHKHFAASTL